MSDDGLDVVLTWLDVNAEELLDQACHDVAEARALSADLDGLEARVARMREELDIAESDQAPPDLLGFDGLRRPRPDSGASPA